MATLPDTPLTEERYLETERLAETKSEFHDGQMFAMAGGSFNHSVLALNVALLLRQRVSPGCTTLNSDMRIKIQAGGVFTYADCLIICGPPQFDSGRTDVILNPLLIVDVLSPSTEGYDRGKKFELYRTIPSFREYLIVHQDRRHVEHFSKQDDGSWLLREYAGESASVAIARIGAQISLAELYASAFDITS